jgi:lipopolysaccharide transport system permease protein
MRKQGWLQWRELWAYRELAFFLTWRDIRVRYAQTAIGVAWAVLQPLDLMVVFTVFFGNLANIPSEGVPYPIFSFAALLPWQLFARSLTEAASSLVKDQQLISRVYFPRLLIPVAPILAAVVDFLVASVLLVGLMAFYGISPGWSILWLPLFCVILMVTALGAGLWLSALNVEYRDVSHALPFLNQLWLFLTPVVYPSSLVPERWSWIYGLNPMTGVVEGFRWALLGVGPGPSLRLGGAIVVALGLFLTGIAWFRSREGRFADVVGGR